tara:strand:- start:6539 stop:8284 length:1746 start_codon:yes stop_codon:yes gene_type:complete
LYEKRLYQRSFIVVSIITWVYLILRAYANPLVFDEATSYFLFVKNGTFWPGQAYWSANNHFLNSLLGHGSVLVFGPQEWALRLPSLIAFPFYALFGFRLMSKLKSAVLRWWAFLLFYSSHGILEFFGYARGYGLMLCFILGSLWYLRALYLQFRLGTLYCLLVFSFLALLSNLSCLPLIGLILLSSLYLSWRSPQSQGLKIRLSALTVLPFLFHLWWILQLREHRELYYGGQNGFISDSLNSLGGMVLHPDLSPYIFVAAGGLFLLSIIISKAWGSFPRLNIEYWSLLSFFLITAFYPLGHWLIQLNFPYDRALIYWLVFGLVTQFVWLDKILQQGHKSMLLTLSWTLVFPLLFLAQVSLTRVSFSGWSKEQIPDRFYQKLTNLHAENIGGSYLHVPQWNFLQSKIMGPLPAIISSDSPKLDYRLSEKKDLQKWAENYQPIDGNNAGLYLLQRKNFIDKMALKRIKLAAQERHKQGLQIYESTDSLVADAISGCVKIKTENAPNKLCIALQGLNEKGEQVYWQAFRARDYLGDKKEWQDWRLFVSLENLPQSSDRLKLFIWNPENETFSLKSSEWTLWKLK